MNTKAPWTDVTFAGVYWKEAARLPKLFKLVRPWFQHIVVGVQDSPDNTLEICRQNADVVVEDRHHGFAEPTFNKILAKVQTPWVFIISGDEQPSIDLLDSFQEMMEAWVRNPKIDAFWFKFKSSIDGFDFTSEQDGHVRMFRSNLAWPTTMHSGPSPQNAITWPIGHINHDRSLDEMIRDYLNYFRIGKGNSGWETHNKMMILEACLGVAKHKGMDYIKSFDWWSEVEPLIPIERINALTTAEE